MKDDPELEPDTAEVFQEEPEAHVIPVRVEGPVRAVELPAKSSGMRRYTLSLTVPVKIAGADPRRKCLHVQVFSADGTSRGALFGHRSVEATSPYAARLAPIQGATFGTSPVLTLYGGDEIWVAADTAVCDVSVWSESWAD